MVCIDHTNNETTALLTVPGGSDDNDEFDEKKDGGGDLESEEEDIGRSSSISSDLSDLPRYNWRDYAPKLHSESDHAIHCIPLVRWCIAGGATYAPQSDQLIRKNLSGLAKCLVLLRQYQMRYGTPYRGGPRDQEIVLREVYTGLFTGGAPIWAISTVMEKVVEGLTGHQNVKWMILPRMALAQDSNSGETFMFSATRSFDFSKLEAMEGLAIRLCSFATNTRGPNVVPSRTPNSKELSKAAKEGSTMTLDVGVHSQGVKGLPYGGEDQPSSTTGDDGQAFLAKKILNLSSKSESIFYFANMQAAAEAASNDDDNGSTTEMTKLSFSSSPQPVSSDAQNRRQRWARLMLMSNDGFWKVTQNDRELFRRLATIDALQRLTKLRRNYKTLYPGWLWAVFRGISSAGAAAFWFNGSWLGKKATSWLLKEALTIFCALTNGPSRPVLSCSPIQRHGLGICHGLDRGVHRNDETYFETRNRRRSNRRKFRCWIVICSDCIDVSQ